MLHDTPSLSLILSPTQRHVPLPSFASRHIEVSLLVHSAICDCERNGMTLSCIAPCAEVAIICAPRYDCLAVCTVEAAALAAGWT